VLLRDSERGYLCRTPNPSPTSESGDRGALPRGGVLHAQPRAHAGTARAAREAALPLCIAGRRKDEHTRAC
jgi:hypothetical protein